MPNSKHLAKATKFELGDIDVGDVVASLRRPERRIAVQPFQNLYTTLLKQTFCKIPPVFSNDKR